MISEQKFSAMPQPSTFFDLVMGKSIPGLSPLSLASDLVKFMRNPAEQRDYWNDIKASWESWSDIREMARGIQPTAPSKKALIFSLSNWPYQLKMEAILGLGLLRDGWEITFLLREPGDRWALRYLTSCGFYRFLFWNQYHLASEEETEVERSLAQFQSTCTGFREVKRWTYRNCWIGPQLLASVSRGIMEGSPDPSNPEVQKKILKLLPKTLSTVLLAEKLLAEFKPDLSFIHEPNYAVRGALTDTAVKMGINIIQVAGTPRDDALIFKRLNPATRREHPNSLMPDTMIGVSKERWTERKEKELSSIFTKRYDGTWFLQSRNQINTRDFTSNETIQKLGLDPYKKTAVVFSHVLWDANLFYGEDLFEDYRDWFVKTVDAAVKNPEVNWIIKLHPANLWKRQQQRVEGEYSEFSLLRRSLGEPEMFPKHVHFLLPETNISTPSLFRLLDVGITVRGTISAELPCWGKPVLTAGTGRCHGHGFTIDSSTKEEYLQRLATIQTMNLLSEETVTLAKKHAHAIFVRRPWVMESFQTRHVDESKGRKTLGQNIHPVPSSSFQDLDRWAHWAGNSQLIDYLEPEV